MSNNNHNPYLQKCDSLINDRFLNTGSQASPPCGGLKFTVSQVSIFIFLSLRGSEIALSQVSIFIFIFFSLRGSEIVRCSSLNLYSIFWGLAITTSTSCWLVWSELELVMGGLGPGPSLWGSNICLFRIWDTDAVVCKSWQKEAVEIFATSKTTYKTSFRGLNFWSRVKLFVILERFSFCKRRMFLSCYTCITILR